MSKPSWIVRVEKALGSRILCAAPLSGGSVAQVARIDLADGRRGVVKQGGRSLALEGWMLAYLQGRLPVPDVWLAEDDLLVLSYIDAGPGGLDAVAQEQAAKLVASLHGHTQGTFGLERDTLIGGLPQPNPPAARWLDFFRDQRLLHMAHEANAEGALPARLLARLETLAGRLERWIEEPLRPALLHGDLWGGNILAGRGKIAGFIDPAISYGHPEIELAFSTLFGAFGPPFFRRYGELRGIAPGFFEERRDLYNLYPLLVHVRLFGGSYVGQVEASLARFGV
jgi:fructosamine-3-kinase